MKYDKEKISVSSKKSKIGLLEALHNLFINILFFTEVEKSKNCRRRYIFGEGRSTWKQVSGVNDIWKLANLSNNSSK